MIVAEFLLNSVCVFPACVVALQWIGIPLRKRIPIAAVATVLSLCTNILSAYYLQDFPLTLILLFIVLPIYGHVDSHEETQPVEIKERTCISHERYFLDRKHDRIKEIYDVTYVDGVRGKVYTEYTEYTD